MPLDPHLGLLGARRAPSASCAVGRVERDHVAPWCANVTAFSPVPQPRSSTRLPRRSPKSRSSCSVGVAVRRRDHRTAPADGHSPFARTPPTISRRLVVVVLHRRRLHEVRRRAEQRAADAAVEGDLGAAHGVDDHAGRVGRVPHLELELDVERHVAEVAALEADVGPLAVVEPRHVVGRADVHVVGARCPGRSGW